LRLTIRRKEPSGDKHERSEDINGSLVGGKIGGGKNEGTVKISSTGSRSPQKKTNKETYKA